MSYPSLNRRVSHASPLFLDSQGVLTKRNNSSSRVAQSGKVCSPALHLSSSVGAIQRDLVQPWTSTPLRINIRIRRSHLGFARLQRLRADARGVVELKSQQNPKILFAQISVEQILWLQGAQPIQTWIQSCKMLKYRLWLVRVFSKYRRH